MPKDRRFIGFDAYKQLLENKEINYVICATPPHFRPIHYAAAVKAGLLFDPKSELDPDRPYLQLLAT